MSCRFYFFGQVSQIGEILLKCKGGHFAFTVNVSETPICFEAEISRYFLLHQGMAPEAHFHWPQGLTSCVHFQRRTERKAPKGEEQVPDLSRQFRPFYNNSCAAPLKLTGVGLQQVSRCNCSSKETVFFKGKFDNIMAKFLMLTLRSHVCKVQCSYFCIPRAANSAITMFKSFRLIWESKLHSQIVFQYWKLRLKRSLMILKILKSFKRPQLYCLLMSKIFKNLHSKNWA